MNLDQQRKLFKLRSILNQISDASFAFKTFYKQYPLASINDPKTADKVIEAYDEIIKQVINSINSEYEISNKD